MKKSPKVKKIEIISTEEMVDCVVQGIQEKKGMDIVVMDLRSIENNFTDYFVVCSGSSDTQIDAISDSIEKEMQTKLGIRPHSMEGKSSKEWVLIDYFDVIVHVFIKDKRHFFQIEDLWGDAKFTRIDD